MLPYPAWTPNGRTRLVIDSVNKLQRAFSMFDLLPEGRADFEPKLGYP